MKKHAHWLDATRLMEADQPRRNMRLLDLEAVQRLRTDFDRDFLCALLVFLLLITAVLVVLSRQFGWWG
jgi:hypothetical protein